MKSKLINRICAHLIDIRIISIACTIMDMTRCCMFMISTTFAAMTLVLAHYLQFQMPHAAIRRRRQKAETLLKMMETAETMTPIEQTALYLSNIMVNPQQTNPFERFHGLRKLSDKQTSCTYYVVCSHSSMLLYISRQQIDHCVMLRLMTADSNNNQQRTAFPVSAQPAAPDPMF